MNKMLRQWSGESIIKEILKSVRGQTRDSYMEGSQQASNWKHASNSEGTETAFEVHSWHFA